jgi:hypothetical protein
MTPGYSLARPRKHVLDRVAGGEVSMTAAAGELGCSRPPLYELRHR